MKSSRLLTTLLALAILACAPLRAAQPSYSSADGYIGESLFTILFDIALDEAHPPLLSSFSADLNGTGLTVTGVTVNSAAKSVTLTINANLLPGDIIDFTYADPTGANDVNALQGLDGTDVASFSHSLVVAISRPATAPVITSALTASGTYGTAISTYTITATNTPTSYNATGLPPGLSINTSNGQITGTPTNPLSSPFSVTISATNGGGTGTATLVFTINKAVLGIAGLVGVNRVYNGTTTGSVSYATATLTGKVGSDSVGVDVSSQVVTFADRNVGTGKTLTLTNISTIGTDAARYTVGTITATANITPKPLTVSGVSAAVTSRVYDGTTATSLTGSAAFQAAETAGSGTTSDGKPYTVDTIAIGGTATGAFTTRHVGTAKPITVSGLTVTGTDSGNYSVTQPTGLTADVTAKALTVTGLTATGTQVYNGTTTASLAGSAAFQTAETAGSGTTSDGKPYTVDTLAVGGTTTATFADRNVGTAKPITVSGITAAGTDGGNYTVTQPTGLSGNITAKPLTVTGLSATATRTYDGTTVAGLTGTAAFQTAQTAGSGTTSDGKPYTVDTIAISGAASGAFATRHVGTAKAITVTGLAVTGTDSGNYSVTQPTGLTADITAKAITISGLTAPDKIYDATTSVALGGTAAFAAAETAGSGTTSDGKPYTVDTIAPGGTAVGIFADKDVGSGKVITATGVTVAGTDGGNYSAIQQTGLTAAITAKALTISGVTVSNKVYDGTTAATFGGAPALQSAEAPGAGTTSDGKPYTGDTLSASGTLSGAFADRHVGTGKTIAVTGVTLSGAQAGNYTLNALSTTANITAKPLTVSGLSAVATRVYDGTTVAGLTGTAAFSAAEVVGTGTTGDGLPYSIDTIAIAGTAAGSFADRHVGTGKAITVTGLTVTGTDSANYSVTQPTGLTADVTAKSLGVAGVTAVATRIYDGTTAAGLSGTPALLTAETAGTGTTSDGKPYTVDTLGLSGTATGAFASRAVGTAKPITVSGLTLTGTDSANYSVTQPAGLIADVTAKALSVTGLSAAATRTYDGTTVAGLTGAAAFQTAETAGSGTTSDGKPYTVDTVAIGGAASGAFATKAVGTGKAITVTGLTATGADAGNYTVTQPTGFTAEVTIKTITVTGITVAPKTYDGTTAATPTYTGATLAGVVAPDTVTLVSSGGTATFSSKTVATGKTVTFAGLTLSGAESANYALTQPTTTADITAKSLTVTGITANSKTFNGTTAATLNLGAAALAGVVTDDVVTLVTSGAIGTFSDANAGGSKTVLVSGLTLTGTDSANYTLTPPTTTASISPETASVMISNVNQTYDGQPKPVTVTVSPNMAATVSYAGSATPPTNAGTYAVSATAGNPNFTGGASATLTIAKAPQTVTLAIAGGAFSVGSSHALTSTATSGGPVTYSVISGTATISGSSVTVTQTGPVTIRATQAGTDNYLAATADQSFTGVSGAKQNQTISFAALPNVSNDTGSVTLNATASSGLAVTYSVMTGPATLSGNRLTLSGAIGIVTVRAAQAGNADFNAAPDVVRAFVVLLPIPDIFFGDLSDDAGLAAGSGELFANAGAHVTAKRGDVAAVLFSGTNRGTLAIVAPSLNLNVSIDFVLAPNHTYSVPFTSNGRALTVTGSVTNGTLTGRIPVLNVSFSTAVQSRVGATSGLAGIYESDAVNSATGGTTTIVSATGQVLVVTSVGSTNTGAVGTIGTSGSFSLTGTGVTIAGSVDAPTTTVSGTVTVSGQAAVPFNSLSGQAAHTDRLVNLSSRVGIAPTRTLITGFVIGGTASKRVLLRGVGPALTGFGVTGALANPKLSLFDGTGKLLLENDDWSGADTAAAFAQVGAFTLTAGSKDAALLTTLTPGAYTVQMTAGAETGTGLVEIYDASADAGAETQRLINISARGSVDTGAEGLLIGGFVVTGNVPKKVLIRGVGPGLTPFGVTGALADPQLSVFSGSTLVARNDDWSTPTPIATTQSTATAAELAAAAQSVGAFALTANSKDAALIITLAPGAYTAQISGANGATGTALVEVYELP